MYNQQPYLSERVETMTASPIDENALYRKVIWRLVPFLLICYVIAYLDRINVGFAKLQMQDALGFSDAVYGLGAGIFFVGYFLFEVPSNLLLQKIGAKKTVTRIMVCWGVVGCMMAFVTTPIQFYVLRFLLGVFEAGFFPGIVYYLGCWFPEARRGQVLGMFMVGIPVAGLLGGPVSGWAMQSLDLVAQMQGWQWLFIVEALPAIVLGVIAFLVLDDSIDKAGWLSIPEKRVLLDALCKDSKTNTNHAASLRQLLRSKKLYTLSFSYFAFICGTYAVSFWLPTMLKVGGAVTPAEIGWLSAIPYTATVAVMVLLCRHSDSSSERRWHTAVPAVFGAFALALLPAAGTNLVAVVALLTMATAGIVSTMPLFWSLASDAYAGRPNAAAAIALINSLGLIGGFASPAVMGWIKSSTGSLNSGLYLVTAVIILGATAVLLSRK
ncbi:MFS transporter [Pseudomonas mosselii]|uniref:MFS transporter n=1 Tax=Pseudomonas mosselii TaxID=78327 RepID=UPI001648FA6B|nr:MFS transporter [Pseudomonas mosselii]MBC3456972.1 MFS transporter [Pseudomonas mosselii]